MAASSTFLYTAFYVFSQKISDAFAHEFILAVPAFLFAFSVRELSGWLQALMTPYSLRFLGSTMGAAALSMDFALAVETKVCAFFFFLSVDDGLNSTGFTLMREPATEVCSSVSSAGRCRSGFSSFSGPR